MSAFTDEQDQDLAEMESDVGTTMVWSLCDRDIKIPIKGIAGSNSFIVKKSLVNSLSPGRPPENGDTLTDQAGAVYLITSANGKYDQIIGGGYSTNSPRNTDNTGFYRIIYSGPEERS